MDEYLQLLTCHPVLEKVAEPKTGFENYEPSLVLIKRADDDDTPFTIAVDLDGTLAEKEKPFDSESVGSPRQHVIDWVKKFHKAGARIIVWTVRGNTKPVEKWLKDNDVPYDHINENPDQPEDGSNKIIADAYLDDRAVDAADIEATGPDLLQQITGDGKDAEPVERAVVTIERTKITIVPGKELLDALQECE